MIAYQLELNQARIEGYHRDAQSFRRANQARISQKDRRSTLRYQVGRTLIRWGFALSGYKLSSN